MIPNTVPGVCVSIRRVERTSDGERHWVVETLPVIAWDSHGCPLILGIRSLETPPGDWRLVRDVAAAPIVCMVPARGWFARFRCKDGSMGLEPLIGWGLKANGDIVPLAYMDAAMNVEEIDNLIDVIPEERIEEPPDRG